MINSKRLIIVTSGTGGHIFPALPIANYLRECGWKIFWIGPFNKLESYLIPKNNFEIEFINVCGIKDKKIKDIIFFPIKIINSIFCAKKIITKFNPNILLGMGGYASVPCAIVAKLLKIPIVIHEQNAIAGLSNRLLCKFASCVLQAYKNSLPDAFLVGNPVRQEISNLFEPKVRFMTRDKNIRILIVGGSQGSNLLNSIIPEVIFNSKRKLIVWHQCGMFKIKNTKLLYKKFKIENNIYKINDFIDNISKAYEWADVIICRSGALTVSEISCVGLAAIFIPYNHKDNHQYFNALILKRAGAAKIFHENDLLKSKLTDFLKNTSRLDLLQMSEKAKSTYVNNSVENICKILFKIAK